MFESSSLSLSHHAGELETTAFHLQLRRLESLQTLMSQGASVVSEVAQFMIKVREELSLLDSDRSALISCQERMTEQKAAFEMRSSELERSLENATLKAAEQKELIRQLEEKCAHTSDTSELEAFRTEQLEQEDSLQVISARSNELEATLERERRSHREAVSRAIDESAKLHAAEMSLMKTRLASLNHQLCLEKERRARLMQVVKTHEISVVSDRTKEMAS